MKYFEDRNELPTKEDVTELIYYTCREMLSIYNRDFQKKWRDPENDEGSIIISEAFCCFLLPYEFIGGDLKKGLRSIFFNKEKDYFKNTLKDFIKFNEKGFMSSPYWNGKKYLGKDLPFIDAACFAITVILLLKKNHGDLLKSLYIYHDEDENEKKVDYLSPEETNEGGFEFVELIEDELDKMLKDALDFINNAFCDNYDDKGYGWYWHNKIINEPIIYCTWTVLESIDDLVYNEEYSNLLPEEIDKSKLLNGLKGKNGKIEKTRQFWAKRCFPEDDKEDNLQDIREYIYAPPEEETDKKLYYNLWLISSLLISRYDKKENIENSIDFINHFLGNEKNKEAKVNYYYDTQSFKISKLDKNLPPDRKDWKLRDRSFIPLYLKVMCKFLLSYNLNFEEYEDTIKKIYWELIYMQDDEVYMFVWDKKADYNPDEGERRYAIYYTERAIEALCRLYPFLPSEENGVIKPTKLAFELEIKVNKEILEKEINDILTQTIDKKKEHLLDEIRQEFISNEEKDEGYEDKHNEQYEICKTGSESEVKSLIIPLLKIDLDLAKNLLDYTIANNATARGWAATQRDVIEACENGNERKVRDAIIPVLKEEDLILTEVLLEHVIINNPNKRANKWAKTQLELIRRGTMGKDKKKR